MPNGGDKEPERWTRILRGRREASSGGGVRVKDPEPEMTSTRRVGDGAQGTGWQGAGLSPKRCDAAWGRGEGRRQGWAPSRGREVPSQRHNFGHLMRLLR